MRGAGCSEGDAAADRSGPGRLDLENRLRPSFFAITSVMYASRQSRELIVNPCGGGSRPGDSGVDVDQLDRRRGGRNRKPAFPQALEVKLDGLGNQTHDLRRPRRMCSWATTR